MTSLDMFLERVEMDAVERVEVKPLRIAMPASRLKAFFKMLRSHYFDNFGVYVRNGVLNSAVLSPTHVTCVRLTVDGVFENPVVEPPLGLLNLENALKALRSIKSDTPLVYDFSQIGVIRYGDMVVYRENDAGLKVEELVWDIEHNRCAEVKIPTKELLSILAIFTNNYDYVRFSYHDGVLKVWDDNMEKVVKAPGWGYLDRQCFTFGYIYESVKGLDRFGCMGVTLSFYTHGSNKPAPMAIRAKIKDILLTIYQAPRIE
ncbi:MAG: hypothetical protein QXJ55_00395 [Candidatus Caldarchaeum sp.]